MIFNASPPGDQSKSMAFNTFFGPRGVNYKRCPVPFSRDQLRNTFLKHDVDGNDQLSQLELEAAFKSLGSKWSTFRAWRSLKAADADGNGYVTMDELDELLDYAEKREYLIT